MSKLATIAEHPFALKAIKTGVEIDKSLGGSPSRVEPSYDRDPDEHEFFLVGVAIALAEVCNLCQQLDQIPVLIGNHRQTSAMDKSDITRHSLILYHLENYIIRTQGLMDRILKLVDAVFHLTNSPKNCRFDVVTRNVKVAISDVYQPLKELDKLLGRYSGIRNEIVHHHSIKDNALRRLDMYILLQKWEDISPKEEKIDFRGHIKETIFEILWFKRKELAVFNGEMAAAVSLVLDKLGPYYTREEQTLRLRLGKATS